MESWALEIQKQIDDCDRYLEMGVYSYNQWVMQREKLLCLARASMGAESVNRYSLLDYPNALLPSYNDKRREQWGLPQKPKVAYIKQPIRSNWEYLVPLLLGIFIGVCATLWIF